MRGEWALWTLHCTENPIYVFPKRKLCDLVPNSYIHVSVSDLYIPKIAQRYKNVELGDRETARPNEEKTKCKMDVHLHTFEWMWIYCITKDIKFDIGPFYVQKSYFRKSTKKFIGQWFWNIMYGIWKTNNKNHFLFKEMSSLFWHGGEFLPEEGVRGPARLVIRFYDVTSDPDVLLRLITAR